MPPRLCLAYMFPCSWASDVACRVCMTRREVLKIYFASDPTNNLDHGLEEFFSESDLGSDLILNPILAHVGPHSWPLIR